VSQNKVGDQPSFLQSPYWRLAGAALLLYLAFPFIPTRYRDARMYRTARCTASERQAIEESARSPELIAAALAKTRGGSSCYSADDLRRMIHIDVYGNMTEKGRFDVEVWVLGNWMTAACDKQLQEFANQMAEELQAAHPTRK
jgi:hypothetical protein